jgi:hypothetical protein
MSQIEQLAAGINEEIKRQGVVLEAYVRRLAELEARCAEIAHAYDVTFKRRTELELAILPFVEFAAHAVDVEQGVWATGVHHEPISTWLGPSDFAAVAKLKA